MPSVPTTSLDLTDPAFIADPYPAFAAERARHGVAWSESAGLWLAFSHAAVSAVQRDRRLGRLWTDKQPTDYLEPFNLLHRNQMMENEGAVHTRLRRPVAAAFARGHVQRLRPRVREIAATLLDEVIAADGFDLMAAYAEPLPVLVICELLGFPTSEVDDLRRWSQAIVRMYEPSPSQQVVDEAVAASVDFAAMVREFIRAPMPGSLIEDLAGSELTEDEVVASVVLLLNAGHEASVNVFGNGMAAALARPDVLVDVRASAGSDDEEATAVRALAVEEMLRFDSAAQLFERTATEPVEVGGITVEEGQKIAVLLGSANRDESVFDAADDMRLDRDPNPHVAFGVGVHFCIGAPLARMELAESLAALFQRLPELELAGEPTSRGTFVLRGHHTVPVRG